MAVASSVQSNAEDRKILNTSLTNDAWNFRSISERTVGMIDSQVGGRCELHHDTSDLYAEDVQLISKDGKVHYLPSRKK